MNATSLGMASFVFVLTLVLVASIHYGAIHFSDWTDRRRRWTCGLLLAGGIVFSVYTYVVDRQLRATTLHEVVFKPGSDSYLTSFEVRAPGVEHSLLLGPIANGLNPADEPFRVHIELISDDGETFIDLEHTFELERQYVGRGRDSWFYVWDDITIDFTPRQAGPHRLVISLLEHRLPEMHIRVEDPTFTEGQRAPGY